jgi:hypothetical protein
VSATALSNLEFDANRRLSARNRSPEVPEEKENARRLRARLARARSTVSASLAEEYLETLGLSLGCSGWLWREQWMGRENGKLVRRGSGWIGTSYDVRLGTMRRALMGEWGLALADQPIARHLVVDVDVHGVTAEPDTEDIDAWLESPRSHARRRRKRGRIAERAAPIADAVRSATPGVTWLPLATPHGLHLIAILDEPLPAADADAIGKGLLAAIGNPQGVEAFPRTDSGGRSLRTCRLPLTGGSRLLADDLVSPRHRCRADDVRELVAMPKVSPSAFAAALLDDRAEPEREPEEPAAAPKRRCRTARVRTARSEEDELRTRLGEHLTGEHFTAALVEAFERGMPDDSSYPCAQKLAAAVTYAGISRGDAELVGRAWIALPHHRATHAETEQGRRAWLRTFRAELRHQERGVTAGRVRPGRLADPELWTLLERLLGRRPGRRQRNEATGEKRRAAARARWSKGANAA